MPTSLRAARGFTIVELIIVIVITGVIAVALMSVIRPALNAYVDTRARAEMADVTDSALRRMIRDVRVAVPNSIRIPSTQCFELVPTRGGGRYRMGPDTDRDGAAGCPVMAASPAANCSAPLQTGQAVTSIDSLSALSPAPAVGDFIVINNQSTNDVYEGSNRAVLTGVATPAPNALLGQHRLTIAATEFPAGYDGGRFTIVPASQPAVFYVCDGADNTLDANGDGKGTLYRLKRNFDATYPTACPSISGADVVARKIRKCTFVYNANQGATQQSGFVSMQVEVARNSESVSLVVGAHVANVP